MAYGTRSKKGNLRGLLPDAIEERNAAVRRARSICAFTTAGSKMRRDLLKQNYAKRQKACEKKRGDIWICGYFTKNDKKVRPHCRNKPKKKKKK